MGPSSGYFVGRSGTGQAGQHGVGTPAPDLGSRDGRSGN